MAGSRLERSRAFVGVLLALGWLACGEAEPPPPGPPASIHGAVVIEPSDLRVGDLVTVELTVITPPEHRVRPVELSETPEALWLLDANRLPVRQSGERWTHITRVRARVRKSPGEYAWPAQTIEIEAPGGELRSLTLPARPFTVGSVSETMPDQMEPFGLRAPRAVSERGSLGSALAGSAATLLLLGAIIAARRWRSASKARALSEPADTTPAWVSADAELEAALAGIDENPRASADQAANSLRRYIHRRAGRAIESLTTEEIAAQRPPGRLRSRWPDLLELLRRLDAVRFPGDLDRAEGRAALRATVEDARRFIADSIPPRELR